MVNGINWEKFNLAVEEHILAQFTNLSKYNFLKVHTKKLLYEHSYFFNF